MKYIIPTKRLSKKCRDDIKKSLIYLRSATRKHYSAQRIQEIAGDYKKAAARGLTNLAVNGESVLSTVSKIRKGKKISRQA
jgi:hypothetical protein